MSRDPIHDGYNWYTYCENDPVNGVDPTGLIVAILGPALLIPGVGQVIAVGAIIIGIGAAIVAIGSLIDDIVNNSSDTGPGTPPTSDPYGKPLPPGTKINWDEPNDHHSGHYDVDLPYPGAPIRVTHAATSGRRRSGPQ